MLQRGGQDVHAFRQPGSLHLLYEPDEATDRPVIDFPPFRKTLSVFKYWRQEILAFFQFLPIRLTNGFVEGKNNYTKALIRRAYGYRNRQHLRFRILLGNIA